jgi:excisionase family DNA binding protein
VLGLVSIIILFVPAPATAPRSRFAPQVFAVGAGMNHRSPPGPAPPPVSAARKGCAVAAHSGKAATTYPSYLHTAEVADILHVSPKTVSRWAKEGKLPFLKTLGGHRRYPEAEIRKLAEGLREEVTT